jgi:hypothetical protein
LVQSELAVAVDVVALYKALGGGWEDESIEVAKGSAPTKP